MSGSGISRYRVDRGTGCWTFAGRLDRDGYGVVKRRGRTMAAHRASYEAHVGPIPDGLVIDHLCGNRACINPAHLEAVTATENARRGAQAKLDPERVREIRRLAEHGATIHEMSRLYGVSRVTIRSVVHYRSWSDV